MSPLIAYHTAPPRCRDHIRKHGLLPNLPNPSQLFGIYVYRDDYTHPLRSRRSRRYWCHWTHRPQNDLWEVAYIGPMCGDQFVTNGLVLFERPQFVSLLSRLSRVQS